ncbi:MAG: sulfatase [Deltaproteobacteria bacterium]|nr:sulfatase [Deltaproteobacteria bacterium]
MNCYNPKLVVGTQGRRLLWISLMVWLATVLACGSCCRDVPSTEPRTKKTSDKEKSKVRSLGVPPEQLFAAAAAFRDQPSPPAGMNVVMIVVDTLRADRLGAYGYGRDTSPNIDAIAREGTLFQRFYAASPWTAPAFGTLFSGMSPALHMGGRILDNRDNPALKETALSRVGISLYPLRTDIKLLAEAMSCCVDTSAAFVSNPFLHPSLGFDRGFALYDYRQKNRAGGEIADRAIAWLKDNAQKQFFSLIHFMDTHQPYNPDEKYRRRFFPMDSGRLTKSVTQKVSELKEMHLTDTELAFLKGIYDAQIREVDAQIGRIVDAMAALGLSDNTWLIVTADHGEEHFDHGSVFHAMQYTDEVIRVPLIIRAPGGKWGAGNQVVYSACQQDVMPTILNLYDAEIPLGIEGQSLLPMMTGKSKTDRQCYMENSLVRDVHQSSLEDQFRKHAWFDGRYKVIQTLNGNETRIYDMDNDALERHPLRAKHPASVKTVRSMFQYMKDRKPLLEQITLPNAPTRLPDDVNKSLENLGYMQ